jgi:uncharacterized protein
MKTYHLIKTKTNQYLYSYFKNSLIYCHPTLSFIIEKAETIENMASWVDNYMGCEKYPENEVKYQFKKYNYLKNEGYFNRECTSNLDGIIKPGTIKNQLANLRQVTFEVTDACNLKCEYCGYGKFYGDFDKRTDKFLSFSAAKGLLDYLFEFWNSNLNTSSNKLTYISFYGGEPLLNMDFIKKVVHYIKENNHTQNRFVFSLTTNALLLNKHIEFFVENEFWILVSLDGNKKNNSYRVFQNGQESYSNIVKNLELVKKNYPVYFKKHINFNAVLHNRNSVNDIHESIFKNYNKVPTIGELNSSGIKEEMIEEFLNAYRNATESLNESENYDTITKNMFINLPNISALGIFLNKYTNFHYKNYSSFFNNYKSASRCPTGTCSPFAKKLYVTVNGKILPCERVGHQFNLGSVNDDKVNIDLDGIANRYNKAFSKMKKKCQKCYLSVICTQCMFYLNIEMDNPKCAGFTGKKEFESYLSNQLSMIENTPEHYNDLMTKVTIE